MRLYEHLDEARKAHAEVLPHIKKAMTNAIAFLARHIQLVNQANPPLLAVSLDPMQRLPGLERLLVQKLGTTPLRGLGQKRLEQVKATLDRFRTEHDSPIMRHPPTRQDQVPELALSGLPPVGPNAALHTSRSEAWKVWLRDNPTENKYVGPLEFWSVHPLNSLAHLARAVYGAPACSTGVSWLYQDARQDPDG